MIATLNSSGNPKQTFHWTHEGPGGLLALTDHRTSPRQTHVAGYDGRGNLTTLLNAADASLSAAYEYAPFGEVIRATGPYAPQNPFGFSTTWTDRTTHLNDYGYRFYHPAEGRFLNQDPIEEQGGNNLYAAFSGDPVNRWDFRGLWAIDGDDHPCKNPSSDAQMTEFLCVDEWWEWVHPQKDVQRAYREGVIHLDPVVVEGEQIEENFSRADISSVKLESGDVPENYWGGEAYGGGAAASPPAQQTETQQEEWKPNKEDCRGLDNQFGKYIRATPSTPFSSWDEAALGALFYSIPLTASNPAAREYGGLLYQRRDYVLWGTSRFYFAKPHPGSAWGGGVTISPDDKPFFSHGKIRGYHTHPTQPLPIFGGQAGDYDNFSVSDKVWEKRFGNLYMGNDTGIFKFFEAGSTSSYTRDTEGNLESWNNGGFDVDASIPGGSTNDQYQKIKQCISAGFIKE